MADFCDFNLPANDKINILGLLKTSKKLGYDCVAINNEMPDYLDAGKKVKDLNVKSPQELKPQSAILEEVQKENKRPFRVLSRFSTVIKDNLNSSKLNVPEIQNYDLVSVQPTTESTFHNACCVLDIDIISLNLTEKLPFYIRKPSIHVALERGIYFEIIYSPAIRDQTMRRHIISNACDLVRVGQGKNVIITSGTDKPIELRGPYDVATLGQLFGMTFRQARDALCTNCRALLLHSEARRSVKAAMSFKSVLPLEPSTTENNPETQKRKGDIQQPQSKKNKKQKKSKTPAS